MVIILTRLLLNFKFPKMARYIISMDSNMQPGPISSLVVCRLNWHDLNTLVHCAYDNRFKMFDYRHSMLPSIWKQEKKHLFGNREIISLMKLSFLRHNFSHLDFFYKKDWQGKIIDTGSMWTTKLKQLICSVFLRR